MLTHRVTKENRTLDNMHLTTTFLYPESRKLDYYTMLTYTVIKGNRMFGQYAVPTVIK